MSYFSVRYFLEKLILRRIKVIYKIISDAKKSLPVDKPISEFMNFSLESVENEVEQWAENTRLEINSLKSLELYRKQFVGDVSHELKTPLFSVQGYLHTLIEGGMYDEKVNLKYLQRALANTERLQFIVEDLDMIHKLESDTEDLNIENFDIRKLSQEIMDDLEMMANDEKIKLIFKNGADNNFVVHADREKIRKVLINLITNSIKYGKENGRTKVSFYDMDKNILIEVSDDGIGIKEEHLKHLFNRFYRVDHSRSRAQGGSGLGLSIVKHIIEAHQQTITVRSTFEQGTTFGFTLQKSK